MSPDVNINSFTIACGQDIRSLQQALTDPQTYGLPKVADIDVANLVALVGRALQALLNNTSFCLHTEARGCLFSGPHASFLPAGVIDSIVNNVLAPRIGQIFMHAHVPVQRAGVTHGAVFSVEPIVDAAKEINHVRDPEPGFCIYWS